MNLKCRSTDTSFPLGFHSLDFFDFISLLSLITSHVIYLSIYLFIYLSHAGAGGSSDGSAPAGRAAPKATVWSGCA